MITRIWFYLLPFVFAAGPQAMAATEAGKAKWSDPPAMAVLALAALAYFLAGRRWLRERPLAAAHGHIFAFWILWVLVGIAQIPVVYALAPAGQVRFSLVKLAKFLVYAVLGIFTIMGARDPKVRPRLAALLMLCGTLVSLVPVWQVGSTVQALNRPVDTRFVEAKRFFSDKRIGVTASILLAYSGSRFFLGASTGLPRVIELACLSISSFGVLHSRARGAWLAMICASLYFFFRQGVNERFIKALVFGAVVISIGYTVSPQFRTRINQTFMDPEDGGAHRPLGFDDSGRVAHLIGGLRVMHRRPLVGSGLFHRGLSTTGLVGTGSHNFWLQMLLETGWIGGFCILALMFRMMRDARRLANLAPAEFVPCEVALVCALVNGLSGEYFYGGIMLLALILVYAPAGSISVQEVRRAVESMARNTQATAVRTPRNPKAPTPSRNHPGYGQVARALRHSHFRPRA